MEGFNLRLFDNVAADAYVCATHLYVLALADAATQGGKMLSLCMVGSRHVTWTESYSYGKLQPSPTFFSP